MFQDCRLRVIKALLKFSSTPAARPVPEGVSLRITHAELAEAIGAARETVSLCLTDLRHMNVVRTGRNQIVFDPEGLRQFEVNEFPPPPYQEALSQSA
jgi:CRP-like cAMP-binding protein